ncbi:MAG TPA: 5-oxoprolinase subunit PxpA [Terrimicrobiaceae bacterium]
MDINCDLGEGEPLAKTRRILRWVTSANIACGGHAGSARTMRSCLRLCGEFGVNAGAHPGFEDRQNFGRREEAISQPRLKALIESQAGTLALLAQDENMRISHIKLHGALYHVVEHDRRLARGYVTFIRERFPGIRIIASPNGHVIPAATRCGVEVWGELFSDRAYAADGGLVPRSQAGAILRDLKDIRTRMEIFRSSGRLPAEDGRLTAIAARTVCVHADSPGALRIARLLAELFRNDGVGLAARRKSTAR